MPNVDVNRTDATGRTFRTRCWALLVVTMVLGACAAPLPKMATVPPKIRARAWTGSPLSGPKLAAAPTEDVEWVWIGVRARALSNTWAAGSTDVDSTPVSAHTTLIRSQSATAAFEATSGLSEWLRVSPASRALWANEMGPENVAWFAIAPSTTVAVEVSSSRYASVALLLGLDAAGTPMLALDVSRGTDVVRLGLDLAPEIDGSTMSLLMPSWPSQYSSDPIALRVRLTTTPPPSLETTELADLVELTRELIAASTQRPAAAPDKPGEAVITAPWPSLLHALESVAHPASRRGALVYLAASSGARLTEEVALTARPALLRAVGELVTKQRIARPEQLGVALESATVEALAALSELPTDIYAVVVQWAGAAGDDLAVISEFMAGVLSLAELDALLANENAFELDSSSPAARLRAFQWLKIRDLAPKDFPIFDDNDTRRAALEAWEAEL